MSEPFIKVFKYRMLNWRWFTFPNTCHLFNYCRYRANLKEIKIGNVVVPKYGFLTSLHNLSRDTGLSIREIRTALKHLSCDKDGDKELTIKTTKSYTIIIVDNYELWQNEICPKKSPSDKDCDKETTTEIEYKNNNHVSKNKHVLGEFKNVKLSAEELLKLKEIYSTEKRFNTGIEILSTYLASKGDKYKSHYAVMGKNNWVFKRVNQECTLQTDKGKYNAFA